MANRSLTLTADTAGTFVTSIHRRRDAPYYLATAMVGGTWGSGTLSWKISPDNGTTLFDLLDVTGVAIVSTANDSFNVILGNPSTNLKSLKIYVVLAGSTNPSLTIDLFDNN